MSLNDWITLNVGGRLYETTRLTLVACPDSLLANMFSLESSRPAAAVSTDTHGAFKIDADPDIFGILLNWLRRNKLMMTDGISLENVAVEAEFFGLIELKDAVEERKKKIKEEEEEQKREFREEQKRKEEKEEKWRKEDKAVQLRKELKEEQQRNEDKVEKRRWRQEDRALKQHWRNGDKEEQRRWRLEDKADQRRYRMFR